MIEFFESYDVILLFGSGFPSEVGIGATIVMAVICLALFILRGIGLYALASRAGYKRPWIAFLPFFNSYLMGRLAGDVSFLGKRIKKIPLFYAVAELLTCVAYGLQIVAQLVLCLSGAVYNAELGWQNVMDPVGWAYYMDGVIDYVVPILWLLYSFCFIVVLFAFFRRYAAKNALIFSVASVFIPVCQDILIFVVRKNKPVDYAAYMHARQEAQYRRYRARYGQSDPYRPNTRGFDEGKDSPFSEFSDDHVRRGAGEPSDFPENDEFFG